MKTYLLPRIKATVFALLLPLMNATLSAQTITRYYAINENHSTITDCLSPTLIPGEQPPEDYCAEIINPTNAIGNNENDYSILKTNYQRRGTSLVSQDLIFGNLNTHNNTNRVVIGIGTNNGTPLSADILKELSILTGKPYGNQTVYQVPDNELIKLGGPDPTRGEIEIPCSITNPCDRINIEKSPKFVSILDLLINGYKPLNELRLYYAYQYQNYQNSPNTLSAYHQNGLFTIDKNVATEGSEITLTNTSGKEVFRSKLRSNTFEANQPAGVYIMTLQTKEGKKKKKKISIK